MDKHLKFNRLKDDPNSDIKVGRSFYEGSVENYDKATEQVTEEYIIRDFIHRHLNDMPIDHLKAAFNVEVLHPIRDKEKILKEIKTTTSRGRSLKLQKVIDLQVVTMSLRHAYRYEEKD